MVTPHASLLERAVEPTELVEGADVKQLAHLRTIGEALLLTPEEVSNVQVYFLDGEVKDTETTQSVLARFEEPIRSAAVGVELSSGKTVQLSERELITLASRTGLVGEGLSTYRETAERIKSFTRIKRLGTREVHGYERTGLRKLARIEQDKTRRWEARAKKRTEKQLAREHDERLATDNARLMQSVGKRVMMSCEFGEKVELADVVQSGYVGLFGMANRSKPSSRANLSELVENRAQTAMVEDLAEGGYRFHFDRETLDEIEQLLQTEDELWDMNSQQPTHEQLATTMGISPDRVEELYQAERAMEIGCLEDLDPSFDRADKVVDELEEQESLQRLQDSIERCLSEFSERDQLIFREWLNDGESTVTSKEIAKVHGVREARVHKIIGAVRTRLNEILYKSSDERWDRMVDLWDRLVAVGVIPQETADRLGPSDYDDFLRNLITKTVEARVKGKRARRVHMGMLQSKIEHLLNSDNTEPHPLSDELFMNLLRNDQLARRTDRTPETLIRSPLDDVVVSAHVSREVPQLSTDLSNTTERHSFSPSHTRIIRFIAKIMEVKVDSVKQWYPEEHQAIEAVAIVANSYRSQSHAHRKPADLDRKLEILYAKLAPTEARPVSNQELAERFGYASVSSINSSLSLTYRQLKVMLTNTAITSSIATRQVNYPSPPAAHKKIYSSPNRNTEKALHAPTRVKAKKTVKRLTELVAPPANPLDLERPLRFTLTELGEGLGSKVITGEPIGTKLSAHLDEYPLFSKPRKFAVTDVSMSDTLKPIIDVMARYPLLTARGEQHYFGRYYAAGVAEARLLRLQHTGEQDNNRQQLEQIARQGKEAYHLIYHCNLRLVFNLAGKYNIGLLPLEDLITEGSFGLTRAIEKFEAAKGYKFSTYATWWIRQSLARATADKARIIRLPVHLHEKVRKIERTAKEMEVQLGYHPSHEELATKLKMKESKVTDFLYWGRSVLSLDEPLSDESDSALRGDLIADDKQDTEKDALRDVWARDIRQAITILPERERRILELRFGLLDGEARTLDDVGRFFGLTRERIRQLEAKALKRLRQDEQLKAVA